MMYLNLYENHFSIKPTVTCIISFKDNNTSSPRIIFHLYHEAIETPTLEENEQPAEEPAPEKSISSAIEQEVIKSVPKIYKAGARQSR